MSNNIVLIGFMGSGKTTVGNVLARKLKKKFIDMDFEIEAEENRSISEIFKKDGESYFREIETKYLQSIQKADNSVISTGGGIVLTVKNREMLRNIGKVIFLRANLNHVINNVTKDIKRPLLQTENYTENIKKLLDEREAKYLSVADITIEVSGKSVSYIKDEILSLLQENI